MSSDPFVHLHVASGYSLRYGASHPHALVERAAEHGMDTLALTDRDGAYGVVKFVQAAQSAGVRPILGVDLAIEPSGLLSAAPTRRCGPRGARARRQRLRGPPRRAVARRSTRGIRGSPCSPRTGRAGPRCAGWSRPPTCAVSAAARSPRLDLIAEHVQAAAASGGGLLVLLGPTSELGRALDACAVPTSPARCSPGGATRSRPARTCSSRWSPTAAPTTRRAAARMLGFATDVRVCRRCCPTPSATPTASTRPPPTCSTRRAGWSPSTPATSTASTPRAVSSRARRWPSVAEEITRSAGLGDGRGAGSCGRHPARRRPVRGRPARRPRASARSTSPSSRCSTAPATPATSRRRRCCANAARPGSAAGRCRAPARSVSRLETELGDHRAARLPRPTSSPSPTSST